MSPHLRWRCDECEKIVNTQTHYYFVVQTGGFTVSGKPVEGGRWMGLCGECADDEPESPSGPERRVQKKPIGFNAPERLPGPADEAPGGAPAERQPTGSPPVKEGAPEKGKDK